MLLKKAIIIKGLSNYQQNGIDLLLMGLHNDGTITTEGCRPNSLIAFKGGTFAITNKDEHIDNLIAEGKIIDCYHDKALFFETVKSQIL